MNIKEEVFLNRHGLKISALVHVPQGKTKGCAFIQHGLMGSQDQPQIQTVAQTLAEAGYIAVSFDSTHSFGVSDGELELCTATTHYNDLEDIIEWGKSQPWYCEPFILSGHSMGGISVLHYLTENPEKVKAVATLATSVGGKLTAQNWPIATGDDMEAWKERGYLEQHCPMRGKSGKISWKLIEDSQNFEILHKTDLIKVPVFLIVGTKDKMMPLSDQKLLADKIPEFVNLYVVEGAGHFFYKKEHLALLHKYLSNWLNKI